MTFHEYLATARQDDAQRAGERDRLLRTARRARRARRHHTGPTAWARHLAALIFHRRKSHEYRPARSEGTTSNVPDPHSRPSPRGAFWPSSAPATPDPGNEIDGSALARFD
jgi:hypothetical protein